MPGIKYFFSFMPLASLLIDSFFNIFFLYLELLSL
jgi:hypothetical protein